MATVRVSSSPEIPLSLSPTRRERPGPLDWDMHRDRITSLYEHHKLPQVKRIMAREHNFHASTRMYRSRLSAWGRDKNLKNHEMLAIAHELRWLRVDGHEPIFFVRGKTVTYESVQRYFKRRGTTIEETTEQTQYTKIHAQRDQVHFTEIPLASSPCGVSRSPKASTTSHSSASPPSGLARTISAPHIVNAPEKAVYALDAYIRGSFDSSAWYSTTATQHFGIIRPNRQTTTCSLYDSMNKLHCQVQLACDLFIEHRWQEGGRFLQSSMEGIREITASAYPPLPTFLPRTLRTVIGRGAPDIALAITRQFAGFAKHYHGNNHPLYQITRFLSEMETTTLGDAVSQMSIATSDLLAAQLGPLHRTTLGARYAVLVNKFESGESGVLIRGIRTIIDECALQLPHDDVRTTNFRLHLARWLLNASVCRKDIEEALEIIDDVGGQDDRGTLDKETAVLLAQAQIQAARYSSSPELRRTEALSRQSSIALSCLGNICTDDQNCVVRSLFWPSSNLWEGKAAIFGTRDGTLLKQFHETRCTQSYYRSASEETPSNNHGADLACEAATCISIS